MCDQTKLNGRYKRYCRYADCTLYRCPELGRYRCEVAQRIIDFSSGSCYSIGGGLQKISSYIFILTPDNVEVSGDIQEILSGAFDIPSMRTNFLIYVMQKEEHFQKKFRILREWPMNGIS